MRWGIGMQILKTKGMYGAWADKHYAYDAVRGPSGTGCDDLFTPGTVLSSHKARTSRVSSWAAVQYLTVSERW